jgi:hypothetical protein
MSVTAETSQRFTLPLNPAFLEKVNAMSLALDVSHAFRLALTKSTDNKVEKDLAHEVSQLATSADSVFQPELGGGSGVSTRSPLVKSAVSQL